MSDFKKNPQYKPEDFWQALALLIEECGEVQAAAGKTARWGPDGVNPELPPEEQQTNLAWLLVEIDDLEQAIEILREEAKGMEK